MGKDSKDTFQASRKMNAIIASGLGSESQQVKTAIMDYEKINTYKLINKEKYSKNRKGVKAYFRDVKNLSLGYLANIASRYGETVDFSISEHKKSEILGQKPGFWNVLKAQCMFSVVLFVLSSLYFTFFGTLIYAIPNISYGVVLGLSVISFSALLAFFGAIYDIISEIRTVNKLGYKKSVFTDIERHAVSVASVTDKAVYFAKYDGNRSCLRFERYGFKMVAYYNRYESAKGREVLEAIGYDGRTVYQISDPKKGKDFDLLAELNQRITKTIAA